MKGTTSVLDGYFKIIIIIIIIIIIKVIYI